MGVFKPGARAISTGQAKARPGQPGRDVNGRIQGKVPRKEGEAGLGELLLSLKEGSFKGSFKDSFKGSFVFL